MARTDQYMGKTQEAESFLEREAIFEKVKPCPHCGEFLEEHIKREPYHTFSGMFETEYNLYKYPLKGGWYALEKLQTTPWSSGPMFFISLEVYSQDGSLQRTIEWSEEDIEEMVGIQ
jgi:hypothetical protein